MSLRARQSIFVGLSGGVDSAVSAALLQQRGHRVVGVFLESWSESFAPSACTQTEDRRDAARVAAHLGVPFLVLPCAAQYRERVLGVFLRELRAGRTPNPDALCNEAIKFDLFRTTALAAGADAIATGHYARLERRGDRRVLLKAIDREKDQSYFLARVPSARLERVHFPVGAMTKGEVRSLARRLRLPNARKPDSQGLCFVGKVSLPRFLARFFESRPGPVRLVSGERVGEHRGLVNFTIGQRHGFGAARGEPAYVVAKDLRTNTLTVSTDPVDLARSELYAGAWRWFGQHPETSLQAKLRYRQPDQPIQAIEISGELVKIRFRRPQRAVTPGQVVAVYANERLAGSGIIL